MTQGDGTLYICPQRKWLKEIAVTLYSKQLILVKEKKMFKKEFYRKYFPWVFSKYLQNILSKQQKHAY